MIDWIMTMVDSLNNFTTYHATNFKVDNFGISINANVNLGELTNQNTLLKTLMLSYAFIKQKRHDNIEVYASSYALDYLRHKLTARVDADICKNLSIALTLRFQDRVGSYMRYTQVKNYGTVIYEATTSDYKPFCLFDAKMMWKQAKYSIYIQCDNIIGKRYYDIGNVKQPGTWIMSGVNFRF